MAIVGQRMGAAKMHETLGRFGFGRTTGADIPGESAGIVNPLRQWNHYSVTSIPMGQEIAVTPLQMARAFSVFANGGVMPVPAIQADQTDTPVFFRVLDETTADHTRRVLRRVVTEGTGRRVNQGRYRIWGKTGTAQVPDRVNGHGRSDSTLLAMTECGLGWVRLDFPSHVREFEGARIRLAPSASARITITDVDGAPVADALVVARPLDLPLGPGPEDRRAGDAPYFEDDDPDGPAGLFRAWTGDDGRVELACLPTASEASTYSFWVLSEDHVLTSVGPRTIEPGSSIALDIVLERVVPTPIEGSVTTRDGLPIEGARVIVLGETIETDADGRYTFPGVVTRANRVGVHVRADGFENDHRILDLEPGTPLDPVDFSLRRATTTSGRLVDASGRALGGVPLGFRDEADFGRAVRIDDHETDADGRFTASKTDDGWWIPDPLFLPDPRPGHAWSYNRLPAVLGGSEGIDIVVPDYRLGETTLIARLVDADSGEPIAPRRANFYFSHEAPVSNWYDARPRLQADRIVAEGLWPGDWKLCVLTDDGRGAIQMVHVEPGDTSLDLRVEIGNPAVVWGRVVWNGIEPRDGVRVFAQPKGPRISPGWNATDGPEALASGDVDLDGSFRLANVLPGDTVLSFHGVPGFAAEVPLIVASGGEHEIDVIFEPRTDVGFRSAAPIVGQSFLLRVRSLDGIDLDPIGPRTDLERFTSQLPKAPPTAPIRATLSLPEGRYAWECTFPRHPRTPGSRIIAEPQSGEFTVVEGEPLEILIPVLPID